MPAKAAVGKRRPRKAATTKARRGARKGVRKGARKGVAPGARGARKGAPRARTAARSGKAGKQGPEAVRAHFARFPLERRQPMLRLWAMVQAALPGSTALVSYGIAIAAVGGRWVAGVGGGKAHVALYLMSPAFVRGQAAALKGHDVSGGTVRFPLGKPLPGPLVHRLVRDRLVAIGQQYGADGAAAKARPRPPAPAPAPPRLDIARFGTPMAVPLDERPR